MRTQKYVDRKVLIDLSLNDIMLCVHGLRSYLVLMNNGPRFDAVQIGISGPAVIVGRKGDETIIKDSST
ncbi:hypothetical protein Ccrd_009512 [Cynara cardunculus var. scolymus]|uniref:Uncharacterized protein n=1 Tax=Cynara cardunculus var. scolymus TaxID=59895 RepID=A0A124SIA3_CYNCS|nr:hypothetical protein Ccrd_009512 [Cynara cardunculus var. scolymus]